MTELNETHVPAKRGRPAKAVNPTDKVLAEIKNERALQDARWGVQNHVLTGSNLPATKRKGYEDAANNWKAINANRIVNGNLGWDGILLEEAFEAVAESDHELARMELVQVAAVAVVMIEALDRQTV